MYVQYRFCLLKEHIILCTYVSAVAVCLLQKFSRSWTWICVLFAMVEERSCATTSRRTIAIMVATMSVTGVHDTGRDSPHKAKQGGNAISNKFR